LFWVWSFLTKNQDQNQLTGGMMIKYRISAQNSLFGHNDITGFGGDGFFVQEIDRDKANDIIKKNHYSGKFYSASYIHLGVFDNKKLKGVLQFGYAMNPASQKSVVKNTGIKEYLELNRMWLSDGCKKNSESKAISYCIKYIKKKYPQIRWIQSFADERCGKFGIVYQASNFRYYGEHTATFWTVDNEVFHNSIMTRDPKSRKSAAYLQANKERAEPSELRQFRYIFFIRKSAIKDCLLIEKPYPKHYTEDVNV